MIVNNNEYKQQSVIEEGSAVSDTSSLLSALSCIDEGNDALIDALSIDDSIKNLSDKLKRKIFDISSKFSFLESFDFIVGELVDKELEKDNPDSTKLLALFMHRIQYLEQIDGLKGKKAGDFIPELPHAGWDEEFPRYVIKDGVLVRAANAQNDYVHKGIFANKDAIRALGDPVINKIMDALEKKGLAQVDKEVKDKYANSKPDIDGILKDMPFEIRLYIFTTLTQHVDKDIQIKPDDAIGLLIDLLKAESGDDVLKILVKLEHPLFAGLNTDIPMSNDDAVKWFNKALEPLGMEFSKQTFPGETDLKWILVDVGWNNDKEDNREDARKLLYDSLGSWQIEMTDEAVEQLNRLSDQLKMLYDLSKTYHKTIATSASNNARNL